MAVPSPKKESDLAGLLEQARDRVRRNHRQRSGKTVVLNYSQDIDRLIQAHLRILASSDPKFEGIESHFAVVAVGGYGRRELNLYSDIDLLFILSGEPEPIDEEFIKAFPYPLWNLRLDLGHAVKTIDQILGEMTEDLDLATSLFTVHYIWGNKQVFTQLQGRLRAQVTLKLESQLSEAVIARIGDRHRRYSETSLLLEPHIKESPGGLRDIHALLWLGFINFGDEGIQALTAHGLLTPTDERHLRRALAFLLELRNAMHLLEGRKTDVLNIDRQIRIAPTLGIEARENMLPEEQLMRRYYEHATVVDRISRRVVQLFQLQRVTPRQGARTSLATRRIEGSFRVRDGAIGVDSAEVGTATRDSDWMMHLFAASALHGLPIDDFTLDLIANRVGDVDEAYRGSAVNRDRFLQILGNRRHAGRTLRQMHVSHFLDAYLPEFAHVRNLPRIDHYHQFTVDEHLLRSVDCALDLFRDGSGFERSHASGAAREILRWDLLIFALLLHDVGKGEGRGHVIRGSHIVQRICERMGISRRDAAILYDLVLNHQRISHMALRRNSEDPNVPRDLARDVNDPELLRMLYVLTCCDLRAVSNESWNDWRASLLATLYERALDCVMGKEERTPVEPQSHEELARIVFEDLVRDDPASPPQPEHLRNAVDSLLADLPDRYKDSTPPPLVARHMRLARRLDEKTLFAWELETLEGKSYAFLHCVARDAPGLFASLCGALATRRYNILHAQIFTARNGVCIDVFQIQAIDPARTSDTESLDRAFTKLNDALRDGKTIDWTKQLPKTQPTISKARLEIRPPQVSITNDESGDGYTLIEVRAPDRPGLLYAITSVFEDFRINVHSALVATESYQIVDVFYVTDWEHNRLEPGPQTEKLRQALLKNVTPAPELIAKA